jgi:hypothetical protein
MPENVAAFYCLHLLSIAQTYAQESSSFAIFLFLCSLLHLCFHLVYITLSWKMTRFLRPCFLRNFFIFLISFSISYIYVHLGSSPSSPHQHARTRFCAHAFAPARTADSSRRRGRDRTVVRVGALGYGCVLRGQRDTVVTRTSNNPVVFNLTTQQERGGVIACDVLTECTNLFVSFPIVDVCPIDNSSATIYLAMCVTVVSNSSVFFLALFIT